MATKTKSKAKSKTTDLAVVTPLYVELPDNAPALGFDPLVDFDWSLVYAQKYLSAEWLEELHEQTGQWLRASVESIGLEQVQVDADDPDPNKAPDIILKLPGTMPKIVMNKSRCTQMARICKTRSPRLWLQRLDGRELEFYVGTFRKFSTAAQVLIRLADDPTGGATADDLY